MFTGIVEETGTVRSLVHPDDDAADAVLTVTAPLAASDARPGDSVAVNGVCLTVTGIGPEEGQLAFDVMPESLRRTTLGALTPGARVNLERALPANGRLGGHIVQGHVDGTATLASREPGPRWDDLTFTAPHPLLRYVAEKGSITLNGVSLTVTTVSDDAVGDDAAGHGSFGVSLIPTTLEATNLGELAPGAPVNVEVDVLAKYTERLLTAAGRPQDTGLTREVTA
ncbi:riboflavin synthase [Myceligenerans crystallogenes]|uniref:Riboflavin synthase n=1 Tax=Myceligenerans crystallogenes TaxID=316335 RepID=A0ABP4ZKD3_9MICO